MTKKIKKKLKGFHRFMKSGRLHKVCKAAGVVREEKTA